MPGPISDAVFVARTFIRAGIVGPARPDRTVRALVGLHRWGPTLAAGYLGAAAHHPDRLALVDERRSLTFDQVHRRTNALARGLAEHGVRGGRAVAVLARNHCGFVEASVACSKLGANVLFLNTAFAGPQIAEVVERENPVAVIYDLDYADAVHDACDGRAGFVAWAHEDAGGDRAGDAPAPAAGNAVPAHDGNSTSGAAPRHPTLDDLIAAHNDDSSLKPPAEPGRIVILTSGTTGTPKGANRASPDSLSPAAALLSLIPLHAQETTVIPSPLFHSWGFAHLSLSTALASTVVLRRRFDPEATLQAVDEHRATALIVVPVMLQRILELDEEVRRRYDTSSLRVIASSGSALPGPLAQRVMDVFGEKLYNLYGSTEVAWATIGTPADLRAAPGTAGKPPRGTAVKILDEDWRECPTGETGRIFVGNEMLFEGYTGGGDKQRYEGLMSTGDVGHFDAGGRLFVDGRDDEMIVSGGENVFPAEVEDLLAGVPGVREVAVVGVRDEQFGQRLRAFVTLEEGVSLTEAELKDRVKANLAGYKVPREIVFMDELPRNATGKILKRELSAVADPRPG